MKSKDLKILKREEFWVNLAQYYLCDEDLYDAMKMEEFYEGRKGKKIKWNILKRVIINIIEKELKDSGERKPPIIQNYNSEFIVDKRRSNIFEDDSIKYAKMLIETNGFKIYINPRLPFVMKRTLLAHELGHTYIFDLSSSPPRPIVKGLLSQQVSFHEVVDYGPGEGLPYEFGREILIPTFLLEKIVPKKASLKCFFNACEIFAVSKQIMANRLYWSIYDFQKNLNYWEKSILIFYPENKIEEGLKNGFFPPPVGQKEIKKGKHFSRVSLSKIWSNVEKYILETINSPNEILLFPNVMEYKGISLTIEARFSLNRVNKPFLYLLLRETRKNENFYKQLKLDMKE